MAEVIAVVDFLGVPKKEVLTLIENWLVYILTVTFYTSAFDWTHSFEKRRFRNCDFEYTIHFCTESSKSFQS